MLTERKDSRLRRPIRHFTLLFERHPADSTDRSSSLNILLKHTTGRHWTTFTRDYKLFASVMDLFQRTFSLGMPWNDGEEFMHRLLRVPEQDNPTSSMLTPQASYLLQRGPLLAVGTLDHQLRPWTTLWGDATGFSEPLGDGLVGTRVVVDGKFDPVVQALVGEAIKGEMLQPKNGGKMLSGLTIDLMSRKRVKIAGRMVAGTVAAVTAEGEMKPGWDQLQMVSKIDESLGNCPKYLNQYEVTPEATTAPELASQGSTLSEESREIISRSDMFFMSTTTLMDMDTNHRGGPQGFVRIISPSEIIYPEYSGNRLYQSLGNLQLNPKIGITFPDMETGNVLYISGTANVLVGSEAAALLPGSNLAVKITIDEARHVKHGLPFRSVRKTPSPYNPPVRRLIAEGNIRANVTASSMAGTLAHLVRKVELSPSVARFTFQVPEGILYSPAQWIALDFKGELDMGYSHMRDSDPTSLNDDFVRTFTISSSPEFEGRQGEKHFEVTLRKVGPVTTFLFQQNERAGTEVKILGVGGDFKVNQDGQTVAPFIAGGVGITPLLGQLGELDLSSDRLKVFWALRSMDIGLAMDSFTRFPRLARCTTVFLTGNTSQPDVASAVVMLEEMGGKIEHRRLNQDDLEEVTSTTWYLCAGSKLKSTILLWLEGKTVVYEDFGF